MQNNSKRHNGRFALHGALVIGAMALAGCMGPVPPAATIPTAPVQSQPDPYALTRRTIPETPSIPDTALPEQPSAPAYSGAVDGRTGMRQSAVVAVTGNASSGYSVLFRPDRTEPASVDSAPAQLCGDAGVASSRKNAPGAGSAMPGVQIMVVKCGAA
ncbi:hypothetical protein [Paracoccus sp. (in: a-proteobacteria)]|uniref:hypothetical protein n=1 Tax=Paracoccus sp. TaxID=267 RepID=UPI003A86FAD6